MSSLLSILAAFILGILWRKLMEPGEGGCPNEVGGYDCQLDRCDHSLKSYYEAKLAKLND